MDADPRPAGISRRACLTGLGVAGAGALLPGAWLTRKEGLGASAAWAADGDGPQSLRVDVATARLSAGDLLVTDHQPARVLLVRRGSVRELARFRSWTDGMLFDAVAAPGGRLVYASMAGLRTPGNEPQFGLAGTGFVFELDLAAGEVTRVIHSELLSDPAGLAYSPRRRALFVADARGFTGEGAIMRVDLAGDSVDVVAEGVLLSSPVGLNWDGPDHLLVGSARASGSGVGGGEVLRVHVDSGAQALVDVDVSGGGAVVAGLHDPSGSTRVVRSARLGFQDSSVSRHAFNGRRPQAARLWSASGVALGSGVALDRQSLWVPNSSEGSLLRLARNGQITATVALPEPSGTPAGDPWSGPESCRLVA